MVGDPALELRQVAGHRRPVPADVWVAIEHLQVVLHLAQPVWRQRGPAEPVGRHELCSDALEDSGELVHASEAGQLGVDVYVDEARRHHQASRIDHAPG